MSAFQKAFDQIKILVSRFQDQYQYFTDYKYSEAEVRKDFIDKFFTILGWDVDHNHQHNPYFQEVKVEKSQRQSDAKGQKRADYAFFLHPDYKNPKFFVEAKKPSRNLKNADDYFQTIRYGWNAGTGVSVLTDFEEFHVIDCRFKPDIDHVFTGRHKVFNYQDYLNQEKFEEIYWLFSYEAIAAGNFEKYIDSLPKPKGAAKQVQLFGGRYQSIDDSFLEYIDAIREKLAKTFKRNDETLNSEILTEAVQRTVDRLVFIRFLEDKLIEPDNYVSEFGGRGSAWEDFIATCRKLDAKYNGVVFKRHLIDDQTFSEDADRMFRNICQNFSHLNTPYDFNAIPIHILGSIYERFLGKVVVATDKRVKIEEKPEVRKAGGVYYTPKFVVDYIVKRTVGEIIKGKTPREIGKMKFADISCGSGSFLIGALEHLYEYHVRYYNENQEEARKDKCLKVDGAYVLSLTQKRQILVNNVYGVDLDHQATEVSQLSLYLKMLEDETTATANEMMVLFHEKILPDLSKNIICGNSLISFDDSLFGEEEERQLNVMNFDNCFPDVRKHGGFNAIIGNPPYVSSKELPALQKEYFRKCFTTATNQFDLYTLFVERAVKLVKPNGFISYIIPDAIIDRSSAAALRAYILQNTSLEELSVMNGVFKDATVGSCVFILRKDKAKGETIFNKAKTLEEFIDSSYRSKRISQEIFSTNYLNTFYFLDAREVNLLKKISEHQPLGELAFLGRGEELSKKAEVIKKVQGSNLPFITGDDIRKYYVKEPTLFIAKADVKKSIQSLYGPKIVVRQVGTEISAAFDYAGCITPQSVYTITSEKEDIFLILGIINSKLVNFIYQKLYRTKEIFPRILLENLKAIPIPATTKENEKLKKELNANVQSIIRIKSKIDIAKTEREINQLNNKLESLTAQVNDGIYQLYEIAEEEISIIEQLEANPEEKTEPYE